MDKFYGEIKITYNEKEDAFELWSRSDDEEWGFVMSCKCYPTAENPNPEYIHFTILKQLEEAIKLGFRLV